MIGLAITESRWNDEAMVWELHVDERRPWTGIGRQLLSAVEAAAAAKDMRAVVLETQTTNVAAIAFYRACGYALHGDRPELLRERRPRTRRGRGVHEEGDSLNSTRSAGRGTDADCRDGRRLGDGLRMERTQPRAEGGQPLAEMRVQVIVLVGTALESWEKASVSRSQAASQSLRASFASPKCLELDLQLENAGMS